MSTVSLRIPDELDERLSREASRENKSRSEMLREAVSEYLDRKEKERFLNEFVAETRAGYGDPGIAEDARAIAEDFLPAENEALDSTETDTGTDTTEKWWK